MSELEDIFAGIPYESEGDPFKSIIKVSEEPQEETPASSQEEKVEETESPASEGESTEETSKEESSDENTPDEKNLPFHMHPRWKALMQERDELRQAQETLQKQVQEMQSKVSVVNSQPASIPDWFTQAYGDDQDLWARYQEENKRTRDEIKQEILQDIRSEQSKAQAEQDQMLEWIDQQMSVLGETHSIDLSYKDGKNSLRNELIKIALEYHPTDQQGNIDFEKVYEIRELKSKRDEKVEKRKEIAQAVSSTQKISEPAKKDYLTPEDLKNKDWLELAKL